MNRQNRILLEACSSSPETAAKTCFPCLVKLKVGANDAEEGWALQRCHCYALKG